MKELQIIVAGEVRTGKSTILVMLQQLLIERGFTVELQLGNEILDYGSEEGFHRAMQLNTYERENAIRDNTKIVLSTKQIQRGGQRK